MNPDVSAYGFLAGACMTLGFVDGMENATPSS
jgi:hypothetical protein